MVAALAWLRRRRCPLCSAIVSSRSKHFAWHFQLGDVPDDAGSPIYRWGDA